MAVCCDPSQQVREKQRALDQLASALEGQLDVPLLRTGTSHRAMLAFEAAHDSLSAVLHDDPVDELPGVAIMAATDRRLAAYGPPMACKPEWAVRDHRNEVQRLLEALHSGTVCADELLFEPIAGLISARLFVPRAYGGRRAPVRPRWGVYGNFCKSSQNTVSSSGVPPNPPTIAQDLGGASCCRPAAPIAPSAIPRHVLDFDHISRIHVWHARTLVDVSVTLSTRSELDDSCSLPASFVHLCVPPASRVPSDAHRQVLAVYWSKSRGAPQLQGAESLQLCVRQAQRPGRRASVIFNCASLPQLEQPLHLQMVDGKKSAILKIIHSDGVVDSMFVFADTPLVDF